MLIFGSGYQKIVKKVPTSFIDGPLCMYVIIKDGMSDPQKKSIAGISRNLLKVQLELTLVNSNID